MTPRRMAERGIETHVLPATSTVERPARHRRRRGVPLQRARRPGHRRPRGRADRATLLGRGVPLFGICFGNQILGRALGLGTYKLRYGHRGINQPVQDRATGKVEVTAHNHGFAVDAPLDGHLRHAVRRGRGQPRLPQRRRRRGAALPRRAGVLGAVPPGGRGRPARRGLPVRPLRATLLEREPLMPKRDRHHAASWSSAPGRSSSARPASSTTPAPRPAGCCASEGLRVILVNSNPATIMTDPEFADATYVEPITPEFVAQGHREGAAGRAARHPRRPDRAEHRGGAARGRRARAVRRRADRRERRRDPGGGGPPAVQGDRRATSAPSRPAASICHTLDECLAAADELGYPVVVRPSFTMGGAGSGLAHDEAELRRIAGAGLQASPTTRCCSRSRSSAGRSTSSS